MRGILFRPEMIRAIVNGSKTQARRAMKPQPHFTEGMWFWQKGKTVYALPNQGEICTEVLGIWNVSRYHPGEIVYLEETHYRHGHYSARSFVPSLVKGVLFDTPKIAPTNNRQVGWHKKSPLFMPAWAARYFINVLKVEACRTRDITPEDCKAEGIIATEWGGSTYYLWEGANNSYSTPQQAYFALYDSINGLGTHEHNWDFRYSFVKAGRPVEGDDHET